MASISATHQQFHHFLNPSPLSSSYSPLFSLYLKPLTFMKFTPFCSKTHKTQHLNTNHKKKRKPKPSFNDQIRVKWSVKPPISQTKNFPWQLQQQEQAKVVEFEELGSGLSESSNLSDDLIGGTQIQEPILDFGQNLDQNLSNNVSGPGNFALANGLCIDVSELVDCKSNFEESIEGIDLRSLSSCRNDVDNANSKDNVVEVREQEREDSEVAFSSRIYDVDNANSKYNVGKLSEIALSSRIYDVDNANSNDYVGKVRQVEDGEVALSSRTYDVDNANWKGYVGNVRGLEDSKVALSGTSSRYDVDNANLKGCVGKVRGVEDSEVALFSRTYDVDNANWNDNVAEIRGVEDSEVALSSSRYDVDNANWKDNVSQVRVKYDADSCNSDKAKAGGDNLVKSKDRLPWVRESDSETKQSRSKTRLAEGMIPEHELKRLRNVALRMKERLKVGPAGVTQALVDTIHDKWKIDEVVKLRFEGPSMFNMKRIHDMLERKTGGLVIWRSGSSVVLFRGLNYNLDCVKTFMEEKKVNLDVSPHPENRVSDSLKFQKNKSEDESLEINELNNMLDELGPRYVDWSGPPPFPVDADLLPPVVPGYKTPFRLRPYGVRQRLRDDETTQLRRTTRITHPHFALGRSRELQGLAAAMVKLWEKSAVAKIAIKRGVLNTSNERMAEELKRLTGGTLLSRNKEYIVFYRGNDFMPPMVTESLKERERLSMLQYQEEEARRSALPLLNLNSKLYKVPMVAGTLAETIAATSQWGKQPSSQDVEKMMTDEALSRRASLVKHLQTKLFAANQKLKKAEKALEKVQGYLEPEELPTDLESITDEERLVFRKMGLSMKPFLLVGRREVFDGTIENIHLHWKFRELVKVIVKGKNFRQVKQVAISLEAESGGLLVSIDRTTKGYAIIIYRGKNYRQPIQLRPKNLLTKRQALARAIELQRREGLKHHISSLQEQIELLKSELQDMKNEREFDDKTFYEKMDNPSVPSDDDVEEDDDEEAYLQTYDSGDENGSFRDDELSQN